MAKPVIIEKETFEYEDINFLPDGNYEIINGERREMAPTGFEHGDFESIFSELLRKHLRNRGYVAVGEVGVIIKKKPLTLRAADVVYISKERSPERPKGMMEVSPDLIIEIVSETNTQSELTEKVKDYLSIGVTRVVLVDPQSKTVSVYKQGKREVLFFEFDEEFELVEGLKVKMNDIITS
ncbi:MAG: Uma2 family endonuclease [Nitrospirae bacterium]|nr:Uma2 family endonuclease [Nitrospirota bacterium]